MPSQSPMNSPNAIQNELKELSSNLPFENKQPVFTVPAGYFENFAAAVWAKIKSRQATPLEELETISPVLAAIPKKMPFSVPENYFQSLSGDLPPIQEKEELPVMLRQASRQLPYSVPEGYFNALAGALLKKVQQPAGHVVSFGSRILRYAAAAAIIGLVVLGGIFYFNGNGGLDPAQSSGEWVARKLEKVSNQELDQFIRTADVEPNGGDLAGNSAREVRNLLNDVTTSELDAFLAEVPTDNEELSVIN